MQAKHADQVKLNSVVLVRSLQTGEVLQVKVIKSQPCASCYTQNGRHKSRVTASEEYQNGQEEVSEASPLGRALLGKERGEIATVEAPAGVFAWEIIEVLNRDSKGV